MLPFSFIAATNSVTSSSAVAENSVGLVTAKKRNTCALSQAFISISVNGISTVLS